MLNLIFDPEAEISKASLCSMTVQRKSRGTPNLVKPIVSSDSSPGRPSRLQQQGSRGAQPFGMQRVWVGTTACSTCITGSKQSPEFDLHGDIRIYRGDTIVSQTKTDSLVKESVYFPEPQIQNKTLGKVEQAETWQRGTV